MPRATRNYKSSKKLRKKTGANAWRKWHDPKASDADYDRWRKEHQDRVRAAAETLLEKVMGSNLGISELVARTALSSKTVRQYVKDRRFGKRGPYLTTYVALRGRVG